MSVKICNTENGTVEGYSRTDADITEFRGIPYAKPPIGSLRLAPPEKPDNWVGIKKCTSWPDAAPQNFFNDSELYPMGKPHTSEDCLYLNIWTPAKSEDDRLPVFVWYHDGGLTNGWSYDPRNNPTELVKKGIVVVAVGSRLGELGYLALPQLTHEQGSSGSYGVMDNILALKWVHNNIAFFGGDPNNVTLGGESGGTYKCASLVAVSEVKGMFRRVISQSGLAWLYPLISLKEAEKFGQKYLKKAGINPNISLDELRKLPLSDIHIPIHPYEQPGKLVADGQIFVGSFKDNFMKNAGGVDFLNCVCSGDALVGASSDLLDSNGRISSREKFYDHFKSFLGDLYNKYSFEDLIQVTDETAWEKAVTLSSLGLSPMLKSSFCRSIMINRIFAHEMAKNHPESSVYNMRFSQIQPNRTDISSLPDVVAPHGSDLWYSNLTLKNGIPSSRPWRTEDQLTAEYFNSYIANFIKTGNPNGAGLHHWQIGGDSMSWLDLSSSPKNHIGIEGKLDELIFEHSVLTYGL